MAKLCLNSRPKASCWLEKRRMSCGGLFKYFLISFFTFYLLCHSSNLSFWSPFKYDVSPVFLPLLDIRVILNSPDSSKLAGDSIKKSWSLVVYCLAYGQTPMFRFPVGFRTTKLRAGRGILRRESLHKPVNL